SYNGQLATSALTFQNEVQTITLLAAGTTRLNFNGTDASDLTLTAGSLTSDISSTIQSNLQAALPVGGTVAVARVANTLNAYTITFGGTLVGQDVAQITSSNTLTATTGTSINGSAPTAAQVQT